MKFYQLAFRYLYRKKSRTFLLLLVMVVINSMILSSNMILRASDKSRLAIQEKMGTKIVLEAEDKNQYIMEKEAERLQKIKEIVLAAARHIRLILIPLQKVIPRKKGII